VFRLKSHLNDRRAHVAQRATGACGRGRRDPFPPAGIGPRAPDGAQPQRGSARVPRGPAIPAARARRPRRAGGLL